MASFWQAMGGWQQGFFAAAVFFSVLFVWQMLAALLGLAGGEDADAAGDHFDADHHDFDHHDGVMEDGETHDHPGEGTMLAFKLLSFRSVLAFGLLFCWAGTFYLDVDKGYTPTLAMLFSTGWGLAAMFLVSLIFYQVAKLQETGTMDFSSSVGAVGEVYITLEEGKVGKIRVMVSGTVSHINARARGGKEIAAGKKVKVVKRLDQNTV